jgi:hypothetical protein
VGLPFLEQNLPTLNCSFCDLTKSDKAKLDSIGKECTTLYSDYEGYKEIILSNISKDNSDELNGRLLLYLFTLLGTSSAEQSASDPMIYNLSNMGYSNYEWNDTLKENEIKGILYMVDLIDKSIAYAKDVGTVSYLKINRFYYLDQSLVLYKLKFTPDEFVEKYDEYSNKLESDPALKIINTYIQDKIVLYNILSKKETPVNLNQVEKVKVNSFLIDLNNRLAPFENKRFFSVIPGAKYVFGKESWLGAELALGGVVKQKKFNLYQPPFQGNFLGFGINYDTKSNQKEFLVNICEIRVNHLMMKMYQFGRHDTQLGSFKRSLFYRPEIGFHYGIIDISYSYNLTFNKEIRPITEKHLFNVGITYPLIRLGKYY